MRYTVEYSEYLKQWYVCDNHAKKDYEKKIFFSNVKQLCEDYIKENKLDDSKIGHQFSLF